MAELSNGSITIRFRNGDHIPPNACKCYAASISHVRLLLLTLLVTLLVTLPACCLLPSFLPLLAGWWHHLAHTCIVRSAADRAGNCIWPAEHCPGLGGG